MAITSEAVEMVEGATPAPWLRREEIGDCTLYLADCLQLMPELGEVDAVITDPPYETELHKAVGRIRRKDGQEVRKDLVFAAVNETRAETARKIVAASRGWAVIFCLAEGVRAWRDELQAAKAKWDTTLAWVKPDAMPRMNGQGAARGFECAATVWCGKGYRKWNGGGKRGVYTHQIKSSTRDGRHPTEKPLGLMLDLVRDYTEPGALVMDPFLGSGTTGLACARLGRRFIGIERDPAYFEVARERIQGFYEQGRFFAARPAPVQERLF